MSPAIRLNSLAQLAEAFALEDLPEGPPQESLPAEDAAPELTGLLSELESASKTLDAVTRQDQEARDLALKDLARYDAQMALVREAELARERASTVRREAEHLAKTAFSEAVRVEAARIAVLAGKTEKAASLTVEERKRELEAMATDLNLEVLLAERRRQEEAEKTKVAEAERARRLSGALAGARSALEAGRLEEAKELLGPVASENPDNAEVASLQNIIAQRERSVKIADAEETLWLARRQYRRDPAAAISRLEAIDVAALPDPLARQVFGEWARACSRLCRERGIAEPLRYAPDPGRGAILAREAPDEGYVVVSALGLGSRWQPGNPVDYRQVRRARPLR